MATRRSKRARGKASKPKSKSKRKPPAKKTQPMKKAAPKKVAKKKAAAPARPAAPKVPSAIGLVNHHMDYTSQDMDGIKRFYTEALGFSEFEHFTDQNMNYLMVRTGPSSSLGFMPPMPGPPEEWRPPREPALYFMVADVDKAYSSLKAKGITFDQTPQDTPWGHRVTMLRDPEGRRVFLAQKLKR